MEHHSYTHCFNHWNGAPPQLHTQCCQPLERNITVTPTAFTHWNGTLITITVTLTPNGNAFSHWNGTSPPKLHPMLSPTGMEHHQLHPKLSATGMEHHPKLSATGMEQDRS